jgi:hypothetical protein
MFSGESVLTRKNLVEKSENRNYAGRWRKMVRELQRENHNEKQKSEKA